MDVDGTRDTNNSVVDHFLSLQVWGYEVVVCQYRLPQGAQDSLLGPHRGSNQYSGEFVLLWALQ